MKIYLLHLYSSSLALYGYATCAEEVLSIAKAYILDIYYNLDGWTWNVDMEQKFVRALHAEDDLCFHFQIIDADRVKNIQYQTCEKK